MLAYNIGRYLKIIAENCRRRIRSNDTDNDRQEVAGTKTKTVRIARLWLLMISAEVVTDSHRGKVRYTFQDSRTPVLFAFLKYLDMKRAVPKPWAA